MLTRHLLQQKVTPLESFSKDQTAVSTVSAAHGLLLYMDKTETLEKIITTPIVLPHCSASPVCEIEAGYAAGVNDYREAIRQTGYPIGGDDQFVLMLTGMCF